MAGARAIGMALDLARMPALATSAAATSIPADILEVMQIAAASPQACRSAEAATGVPAQVLTEAAQFFLQHVLFNADADCYRILGLQPGAPRDLARRHLRWLLQWLHPDRNGDWNGIYAERVIKAWHEISALEGHPATLTRNYNRLPSPRPNGIAKGPIPIRLAWIRMPPRQSDTMDRRPHFARAARALTVALSSAIAFVLLAMTAAPALGQETVLLERAAGGTVSRLATSLPDWPALPFR